MESILGVLAAVFIYAVAYTQGLRHGRDTERLRRLFDDDETPGGAA